MNKPTLYMFDACPFCKKVLDFTTMYGIDIEIKDVRKNKTFKEELIAIGGKKQVPFLQDEDAWIQMYETQDIIAYLEEKYVA